MCIFCPRLAGIICVEGFVAKDIFNMEDVSGFAVLHCSFPVAESMERDLIYSGAFEFCTYSFALVLKVVSHHICINSNYMRKTKMRSAHIFP